jgi:hypothetical protein
MKLKYFFLFIASAICYSNSLSAQGIGIGNTNPVKKPLKVVFAKEYSGIDSGFVKDRTLSVGIIRCPLANSLFKGLIVAVPYKIQKKEETNMINVGELGVTGYYLVQNVRPLTNLASGSEVDGSKIKFACSIMDIIIYKGLPQVATGTIYGTYDTSNGSYSIKIHEDPLLDE